jgi:hypothetical protein
MNSIEKPLHAPQLCHSLPRGTSKLFIQEVLGCSQLCCSYEKLMIAFPSTENCLILQQINKEESVWK